MKYSCYLCLKGQKNVWNENWQLKWYRKALNQHETICIFFTQYLYNGWAIYSLIFNAVFSIIFKMLGHFQCFQSSKQ